jgi:hypothetical protein
MQNLTQLLDEIVDMVACALLAEFTKMGEVFTNLSRTNA